MKSGGFTQQKWQITDISVAFKFSTTESFFFVFLTKLLLFHKDVVVRSRRRTEKSATSFHKAPFSPCILAYSFLGSLEGNRKYF